MPRIAATTSFDQDYFDSLIDLASYCLQPRNQQSRRVPFCPDDGPTTTRKLTVCHDYKGGYTESSTRRDYTYRHWASTYAFIYFSHHRLSLPPKSWINTAHRHGVKMMGCLIFEYEESRSDVIRLVRGDKGSGFGRLSLEYADYLVELAIERSFEGYLINVEIELGERTDGGALTESRAHATALINWVAYLRLRIEAKVVGGEVMWYDAVTKDGALSWQDQLNPHNSPFFSAASSIFLNYTWQPHYPVISANAARSLSRDANEVFVGVDVWGRGQFGGAGFESSRSLNLIGDDLSIALFAPGWSAEFFNHDLHTREGHKKWREDDDYLWKRGSQETSNAIADRGRLVRDRRTKRGVQRARELALATITRSFNQSFDYDAPFEEFPPVLHSPISSFFTSRRPSGPLGASFYTNFSEGSGHDCYIGGHRVMQTREGWSDVEFHWPALDTETIDEMVSITETDAYMGECSVKIELTGSEERKIRLSSRVSIQVSQPILATIIWKPSSTGILLQCDQKSAQSSDSTTDDLLNGWLKSTVNLSTTMETGPIVMTTITLSVHSFDSSPSTVLIGSVALVPSNSLPQPFVMDLSLKRSSEEIPSLLRWKVGYRPVSLDSTHLSPRESQWPAFLFFSVSLLGGELEDSKEFLGTTFENEFEVMAREGILIVIGIKDDGTPGAEQRLAI